MLQMLQKFSKSPLHNNKFFIYVPSVCRLLLPKEFFKFQLSMLSSGINFFLCSFNNQDSFQKAILLIVKKKLPLLSSLSFAFNKQILSADFAKILFTQQRNLHFFNNLLVLRLSIFKNYGKSR